ncbi:MAG: hypothetical protein HFG27_07280 [Provencibacterium sp.]|jgi:alginate O-acetyltransferase complex protein AlgI|nr:hypothetical protein [Provencibacterium sp.]
MTFFSLTFLLIFLPAGILLYYALPNRFKNTALLLLSLCFYGLAQPHFLWLMAAGILFDYGMACIIHFSSKRPAAGRLACLFSFIKSGGYILYGALCVRRGLSAPVGIWIYTLSASGYLLELFHREAPFEQNLVDFALYNCFFGRIFWGPYVKYTLIRPQLKKKRLTLSSVSSGLVLMMQGVAKKVVLGDSLFAFYQSLAALEERDRTLLSCWMLLLSLALSIHFIFSGYCDVARGLGQIFSFKMPRNIFFPLHAHSVRELVERFNISWMDYLRRQFSSVSVLFQGSNAGDIVMVIVRMLLYGAWLSFSPNGLWWGLYLALFFLAEKYFYGRALEKLPYLLGKIYTWLAFLTSLILLARPFDDWGAFLKTMFHFEPGLWYNDTVIYILSQNYWVLTLGLLLSYPVMPKISAFFKKKWPVCADISSVMINLGLMILIVMFLI